MAVKTVRTLVCDFGERHRGTIRQYRITVDGETKTLDLCPGCAKPLTRLWDRGGTARPPRARMQVLTLADIEATKKPPSPK